MRVVHDRSRRGLPLPAYLQSYSLKTINAEIAFPLSLFVQSMKRLILDCPRAGIAGLSLIDDDREISLSPSHLFSASADLTNENPTDSPRDATKPGTSMNDDEQIDTWVYPLVSLSEFSC